MKKVAIVTDSNAGISPQMAKELGVFVIPQPFMIEGKTYFENIDLTYEEFYKTLENEVDVRTSQPVPTDMMEVWDDVLKEYDELVHIPLSSGLSGACQSAMMFADEYDGRVHVVNNQRISVTQKQSVRDALMLIEKGHDGKEIKQILEEDKFNSSIYIMLDTLKYLKKGGRITPAAAAIGTVLKLKPVLQIQGEKLDAFAKARTINQGKKIMIDAIRNDVNTRFGGEDPDNISIHIAHTNNHDMAMEFKAEFEEAFPGVIVKDVDELSLVVSCHIGPGALAVAVCKTLK
ncbi:MAG: DegV family protein [Lachnospiraceae bacterium]|nr:DegV family protein [Lachnospiraceae bacterium]